MVNRKRKVKVVEKIESEVSSRNNLTTENSIPYFRGLTDCFKRTETMGLETSNGSIDYDESLKSGVNKEKTHSPLPNFKSR